LLKITKSGDVITFNIRVIPRSSKTEIVGEHDGALKIKLKAPPVDGAANEELVRFLSKTLDIPRSNIGIIAGATSRTKKIRITCTDTSKTVAILRAKI
jgi:uncharacterized protein (TIGR00251 family)